MAFTFKISGAKLHDHLKQRIEEHEKQASRARERLAAFADEDATYDSPKKRIEAQIERHDSTANILRAVLDGTDPDGSYSLDFDDAEDLELGVTFRKW